MAGWTPISPWKIIPGSGQTVSNAAAGALTFTNQVGPQTDAIAIRLLPETTPYMGMVRVGSTATVAFDYPISSTDPPQIIGVSRGQTVSVYTNQGSGNAGAFMCELTH